MRTPNWFLKKSFTAYLLLPFSAIYFVISKLVFLFRKQFQKSSKTPVICIGGILAGGVGKTPIVREIAGKIKNSVIVMRGYGGTKSGRVLKTDTANTVGDEAKMLSNHGIDVYVGNRIENIKLIESQVTNHGFRTIAPRAIIMDDGFQNPSFKKDISILVFDENIGIGNGFILPAGPLREPLKSGLSRADAIIVVKNKTNHSSFLIPHSSLFYATQTMDMTGISGNIIAFAGIGYPEKFFAPLRKLKQIKKLDCVPFPDHHPYTNDEITNLVNRAKKTKSILVTTEKDWVKLPAKYQKEIHFIPLKTTIEKSFWDWIGGKLNAHI